MALAGLVALVGGLAGWSALKADSSDQPLDPPAAVQQTPALASHAPISHLAAKVKAAYRKRMAPPKDYRPAPKAPKSPAPKPAAPPRQRQTEPPRRAAPVRAAAPVEKPQIKDTNDVPAGEALASPAVRNLDPRNFTLTGIMEGPDGAVAIINGYPVRLGEAVGEAKLVKIGLHSVVLELSGCRVTVRM